MQTVYVLGRPLPIASLKMLKRCTAYVCLCDVVLVNLDMNENRKQL